MITPISCMLSRITCPTDGVLCCGERVRIVWPAESDVDQITELRNRPAIRRWFLDSRPLDPQKSREWLLHGMRRGEEAILTIRWMETDAFLGTIGWSSWDQLQRTACFGRLMIDHRAQIQLRQKMAPPYVGAALDAALALLEFAFTHMGLQAITTWYLEGNHLAARANRAVGMEETGRMTRCCPDGSLVRTVELRLDRDRWTRLRACDD